MGLSLRQEKRRKCSRGVVVGLGRGRRCSGPWARGVDDHGEIEGGLAGARHYQRQQCTFTEDAVTLDGAQVGDAGLRHSLVLRI